MERRTHRGGGRGRALELDLDLVRGAAALIATGNARRVVVGGLRAGDRIARHAQRIARQEGVRVIPLWGPDGQSAAVLVAPLEGLETCGLRPAEDPEPGARRAGRDRRR
jgi:hypothetical protein